MKKSFLYLFFFISPIFPDLFFKENTPGYSQSLGSEYELSFVQKMAYFSSEMNSEESLFRRGEVIFFLSFPFAMLINTAVTYLVYQEATGKSHFPSYLWGFSAVGAVLFSLAVVAHDQSSLTQEKTYYFRFGHAFRH